MITSGATVVRILVRPAMAIMDCMYSRYSVLRTYMYVLYIHTPYILLHIDNISVAKFMWKRDYRVDYGVLVLNAWRSLLHERDVLCLFLGAFEIWNSENALSFSAGLDLLAVRDVVKSSR
ncbi:hypothetical protein BDV28DRAFT_138674 [Aspergillus coremiiformis]|uniref:Uncharacterized protein n=1 Tax=Aspergillus coremiiformis TaxID=138285 RepID=A0A5N6YYZ6_9EURO|nr:hypothetical protein BDV28DRAFT_138674 [Aspergillus coremiiformis]